MRKSEIIVADFNKNHTVGTIGTLTLDNGKKVETETRHHAVVANSGDAVCWFKGITGYYRLDRFEPKK